jgi:hypothetical protein
MPIGEAAAEFSAGAANPGAIYEPGCVERLNSASKTSNSSRR